MCTYKWKFYLDCRKRERERERTKLVTKLKIRASSFSFLKSAEFNSPRTDETIFFDETWIFMGKW